MPPYAGYILPGMSDCPVGTCTCPPRPGSDAPAPTYLGWLQMAAALEARAVTAESRLAEALAREAQCCRWRDPRLEPPTQTEHVALWVDRHGHGEEVRAGYLCYGGGTWMVFGWPYSVMFDRVALWMPLPAPPPSAAPAAAKENP